MPRTLVPLVAMMLLLSAGCSAQSDVDRIGLNADELRVGDCLDSPPAGDLGYVCLRACDEPHDSEVFAVVSLEPIAQTFPGEAELFARARSACIDVLREYARPSPNLGVTFLLPTDLAWQTGFRTAPCLAVDTRGRVLTSTIALVED
jgi:hypothetical protein